MRLAVITAILASVALVATPAALADGDPASDVLAQSMLFNPGDSGVSITAQTRLERVLVASERAGFPIRVALIASAGDLGTVATLWKDPPKEYACYLWLELSDLYRGQVLVVMPNGFGICGPRSGPHAVSAAELRVRAIAPGQGAQLATAALSAVPLLARAAGHPLASAALVAADRAQALGEKSAPRADFSPSIVIALIMGALLIALSWTLSLRARPLRLGRRLEP